MKTRRISLLIISICLLIGLVGSFAYWNTIDDPEDVDYDKTINIGSWL